MLLRRLGKFLHIEEQGVVLAALATLAHFHIEDELVGKTNEDVSKELFSGKKTEKLLGLVSINVITCATSGGDAGDWEERLEQIKFANVILSSIDDRGKEAYVHGSGVGKVLENLVKKMDRLAIDGDVRVLREVLKFCIKLSPSKLIPGVAEFSYKLVKKSLDDEAQGKGSAVLEESMVDVFAVSMVSALAVLH